MSLLPFTTRRSSNSDLNTDQGRQLIGSLETETERAHGAVAGAMALLGEVKRLVEKASQQFTQSRSIAAGALALLEEIRRKVKISKINSGGWEDLALDLAIARSLFITNNSGSPNSQMDIDATSVTLVNSAGHLHKVSSVNLTVDITASGLNGLDTGSEAASTWYHLWVIWNGVTVAGLLSTSATSPTMPSGYTYKGYVGAVFNGSGSNFIVLRQNGYYAISTLTQDVNAGVAAGFTSFTITAPTTAKLWYGSISVIGAGGLTNVASDSAGAGYQIVGTATAAITTWGTVSLPIFTAQTMWYLTTGTTSIYTAGWSF